LQSLYDNDRVVASWQAIHDALEAVHITRHRRMITVGGCVSPLIVGFDLPVALLALTARATVAGPKGRRVVPLPELYDKRMAKDEMLIAIELDPLPARSGSSFYKYLPRHAAEIPCVNTAAVVTLDKDGKCRMARVMVGAVSWKPIILEPKELVGQHLTDNLLREVVQGVRSLAQPMANVRGSVAYKREMAVEFAARALITAAQRAAS
jgi:aerobic carbon-monoxide dehydrogenase medium subunit